MKTLCDHMLVEFYDCNPARIQRSEEVRETLLAAAREARATLVTDVFHTFSPYGVSGVVVIAESHITIHTWPEHGYAAVDIFSCDPRLDRALIRDCIRRQFEAGRVSTRNIKRGNLLRPSPVKPDSKRSPVEKRRKTAR
jgi:S-adenosylmethionine decarboxylase